jgi:hypothetical protein
MIGGGGATGVPSVLTLPPVMAALRRLRLLTSARAAAAVRGVAARAVAVTSGVRANSSGANS